MLSWATKYKVNFANTNRLKNSSVITMQKLLNEEQWIVHIIHCHGELWLSIDIRLNSPIAEIYLILSNTDFFFIPVMSFYEESFCPLTFIRVNKDMFSLILVVFISNLSGGVIKKPVLTWKRYQRGLKRYKYWFGHSVSSPTTFHGYHS